ncbi:MAG TPA: hypothetical protein PKA90_04840 [Ignavibacteria bacterium]|nr:hypothetical protein [Ignavibacteria bacterium]HMR39735.1 hypothetical protein [Ignavibacteria bacterium]
MISEFKNLTEEESSQMLMAPALVTLLIAGAEGKVDQKETDWATKITHMRAGNHTILQDYFQEVDQNFTDILNELIIAMPENTDERAEKINSELSKLNDILPKLDKKFAVEFYKSLLSLSTQVAQASGGVFGYGSISPEEKKFLDLDAINSPE